MTKYRVALRTKDTWRAILLLLFYISIFLTPVLVIEYMRRNDLKPASDSYCFCGEYVLTKYCYKCNKVQPKTYTRYYCKNCNDERISYSKYCGNCGCTDIVGKPTPRRGWGDPTGGK